MKVTEFWLYGKTVPSARLISVHMHFGVLSPLFSSSSLPACTYILPRLREKEPISSTFTENSFYTRTQMINFYIFWFKRFSIHDSQNTSYTTISTTYVQSFRRYLFEYPCSGTGVAVSSVWRLLTDPGDSGGIRIRVRVLWWVLWQSTIKYHNTWVSFSCVALYTHMHTAYTVPTQQVTVVKLVVVLEKKEISGFIKKSSFCSA